MKRVLAIVGVMAGLGAPALADPVLGTYKTQPGDAGNFAHVQIYQCEADICGVIRKAFNGAGQQIESDTVGKRMIWGMKPQGSGKYAKGKIWAPDRDRTYNSRMELSGSRLEVSGCVLGICRGQTWTRVN
ncbi:MAG: DUF2147 domain-containing protein [Pseudomonadota bacterium]